MVSGRESDLASSRMSDLRCNRHLLSASLSLHGSSLGRHVRHQASCACSILLFHCMPDRPVIGWDMYALSDIFCTGPASRLQCLPARPGSMLSCSIKPARIKARPLLQDRHRTHQSGLYLTILLGGHTSVVGTRAHWLGTNVKAELCPVGTTLLRGWRRGERDVIKCWDPSPTTLIERLHCSPCLTAPVGGSSTCPLL